VLPLCHPAEAGRRGRHRPDQISHGRLIFGVGRSGFPRTYEGLWRAVRREPRALRRDARNIEAGLDPGVVSPTRGQYYSFDNVKVTPKPYQKPWPEIRVAANSADTFPNIAKAGHAVFVAVRLGTLEELEPNITAYRQALERGRAPR